MNKGDVIQLDNAARLAQQKLNRVIVLQKFERDRRRDHPFFRHEVELLGQLLAEYDHLANEVGSPPLSTEAIDPIKDEPDLDVETLRRLYRRLAHRIRKSQPVVREGIPVDVPDDNDAIHAMFEDFAAQLARAADMGGEPSTHARLVHDLGLENREHVRPPPRQIGRLSGNGNAFGVINLANMQPRNADGTIGPPAPKPLSTFLDGIQRSLQARAFGPALLSALVVPDACGAIEYPQVPPGATRNKYRYVTWYDRFVEPVVDGEFKFAGEAAWGVRNGMIHETGLRFTKFGYDRVIFVLPGDMELGVGFMRNMGPHGESAFALNLQQYIAAMIGGAKRWLESVAGDGEKQALLNSLIQLRPEGLAPFFMGVPVLY